MVLTSKLQGINKAGGENDAGRTDAFFQILEVYFYSYFVKRFYHE